MKHGRLIFGLSTGVIVGVFLILSFVNYFYRSDIVTGTVVAQEVKRLTAIFQTIHKQCKILGFDNQQHSINFLNVESFVGSEVGPMNLAYPEKWGGPYVGENPTVQSKEFMVVRTDGGYFITPGNGVRLPNGKIVGKDILLGQDTDITALIADPSAFLFQGRSLAQKLDL